ncbi:MAG: WD40 repeat domain-containing protein, partial [Desulfomonilaceae bacterium]
LGGYGSCWASALYEALEQVAKENNPAPLYICWLLTGLPRLAAAAAEGGWIPGFAAHVRVRECLASGDAKAMGASGVEAAAPLINAALVIDGEYGSRAAGWLRDLSDPAAVDFVCRVWLEHREPLLADIIKESRYIASGPSRARIGSALLNRDLIVASDVDAVGVAELTTFLGDDDDAIRSAAAAALLMLKNPEAINALVSVWACQRTPELDGIVGTAGYVATDPPPLKVLSALRNERYDELREGGSSLILPLLMALRDEDGEIVDRAAQFLPTLLDSEEAADAFCLHATRLGIPLAMDMAARRGLVPQNAAERALFFFLTEQWDEYEACDFDLSILRQWFEHGGKELRLRIGETARRAGRLELVELVSGVRHRRKMGEMTAREWQTALSILRERGDWETMWRMAVAAPAVWAVEALRELRTRGWAPADGEQRSGFERLTAYALRCEGEPPTIGMDTRPAYHFVAHKRRVSALIVSSYFHRALATASWDGSVSVWDMRDGSLTASLQAYSHPAAAIAATPDGSWLFAGSGAHSTVVGWTMPDAAPRFSLTGHAKGVACLAASPDGRMLAAGGYDNVIYLWRLSDQRLIAALRSHAAAVRCVAFSPDGQLLASGAEDGELRLWDVPGQRLLSVLTGHRLAVRSVCFSPDGDTLVSGSSDNELIIWDLPGRGPRHVLRGHHNVVSAAAVSGDGRVVASAGWDERILLWELATGAILGSLRGHAGPVTCLATDAESRALVSGGHDSRVFVWHFQSGIFRRATRRDEMEKVDAMLRECSDDAARPWLEFLLAQMRQRWRFDIEIADGPPCMEIGEFDIEIGE